MKLIITEANKIMSDGVTVFKIIMQTKAICDCGNEFDVNRKGVIKCPACGKYDSFNLLYDKIKKP